MASSPVELQLENKRVIVVGLGKSGLAAARFCAAAGAEVVATDHAPAERLSEEVGRLEAHVVLGGHAGVDFGGADLIVISPGVPAFPALNRAEAAGVPVISEIELASRYLTVPVVAVGGTNGKSTTTKLVGTLLAALGQRVFVGGNLGTPLIEAVGMPLDVAVAEVSSFQLERVPTFAPHVSVLLNISEDHLDRYATFADYAQAKGNAFVHQGTRDVGIVPAGDALCLAQLTRGQARKLSFGTRAAGADYFVEQNAVVERASSERFDLTDCDLRGLHNQFNAAAAVAAARCFDRQRAGLLRGLREFAALPHRMQLAGKHGGVTFYDDSKATNVGAAVTALLGLEQTFGVLIAGGRDKLGDYGPLVRAIEKKARAVVVIGEASDRICQAIGDAVAVRREPTLEAAVVTAFGLAEPGDAVLLSPACSSFDMFSNYAERGRRFQLAVRNLGAPEGSL